jgi:hypothetical protein
MKTPEEQKIFKKYKIQFEPDEADNMEKFAKMHYMTYTGCFRRGARLLIESENHKNQILESYHSGQNMNNMK